MRFPCARANPAGHFVGQTKGEKDQAEDDPELIADRGADLRGTT